MANDSIKCPKCGSDAYHRYGFTKNGKVRRLCLVCERQYVVDSSWRPAPNRPDCPVCKQPMHVYRRHADAVRYRCRNYPECKTFVKVDITPAEGE